MPITVTGSTPSGIVDRVIPSEEAQTFDVGLNESSEKIVVYLEESARNQGIHFIVSAQVWLFVNGIPHNDIKEGTTRAPLQVINPWQGDREGSYYIQAQYHPRLP